MGAATGTDANAHYNSDANYQAFLTLINDVLDDAGLTQTADTGQFTGTETRPSLSTAPHYQIREFGNTPLYVKVSVGCGTANTRMLIGFEVGTGSNGTGSITGSFGGGWQYTLGGATSQNWTSGGATLYIYGSSTEDVFLFVLFGDADHPANYAFQRRLDDSGAQVMDGQCAIYGPSVNDIRVFDGVNQIGSLSSSTGARQVFPLPWPTGGTREGSDIALYPAILPWDDPVEYGFGDAFILHRTGEIGSAVEFSASIFPGKAPRLYKSIGVAWGDGLLAIQWEA